MRIGLPGEIGYTARRKLASATIPVCTTARGDDDGGRRQLEHHPEHADGRAQGDIGPEEFGGTLTGTQSAEGNSVEIFDGTATGDDLAWKVSITNPMPLTLEFTGKVSGNSIAGEMGIGPIGSFPFTGARA